MRAVLGARGDLDEGARMRLAKVEQLFGGPFAANDARRAAAGE